MSCESLILMMIMLQLMAIMVQAEMDLSMFLNTMVKKRKSFVPSISCRSASIGPDCSLCCNEYGEEMNGKNSELSKICICTNQLFGPLYTIVAMKRN